MESNQEKPRIGYDYLPPEEKLKVLQYWVSKTIDIKCKIALGGKVHPKLQSAVDDIRTFAMSRCRKLIPGTMEYAKIHARYCFYCKAFLTTERTLPVLPTELTVDHFFPKGHEFRQSNIHVICCVSCNSWKADKSPESLIEILSQKKEVPKGWTNETLRRIKTIMRHHQYNIYYNGYFITKRKDRI